MATVLLGGDAMTGRGVDQILPHPCAPGLVEPCLRDAREYVALAEAVSGPVPRPAPYAYPWGEALPALADADARVVNLETSVTCSEERWPGKDIHYRMSPGNAPCLTAAGLDVCALANNHVLDHGRSGLRETLATLEAAGVRFAGAGRDLDEARRPAVVPLPGGGRLLVFAFGTESSGIPPAWAAGPETPGVALLEPSDERAEEIGERVRSARRPGDLVIASLHWGSNWGYGVPAEHVRFARRLVERGVDLVHGHSSHHARPLEVHRGRLILYGCGELIDDYEGIEGWEEFRPELVLAYQARLGPGGELESLRMAPFRIRRLSLARASRPEAEWLAERLSAVGLDFGCRVEVGPGEHLTLAGGAAGRLP